MSEIADLKRLGRTMQNILAACALLLTLAVVWVGITIVGDPLKFMQLVRDGAPGDLAFPPAAGTIAIVTVIAALQFALLLGALYCVWRMFGALAGEEPLSLQPAIWMRRASIAFVVVAIGGIIARTAIWLALTMGNPPGQRSLSIGVGSGEVLTLVIALVMYMMGRVMMVAAEVRADQKGFV